MNIIQWHWSALWVKSLKQLEIDFNIKEICLVSRRYSQALRLYHYLAYLLDLAELNFLLIQVEKETALQIAGDIYPSIDLLQIIIKLEPKSNKGFKSIMNFITKFSKM